MNQTFRLNRLHGLAVKSVHPPMKNDAVEQPLDNTKFFTLLFLQTSLNVQKRCPDEKGFAVP
jgi:hypothetical protein